jgi:hypothetical protein
MEEYAKTTDMKKYFTDSLFLWFTLSPFLKNVKDYMRPYATGIHDDEWNFKTDDEIKKEREQIEKEEKFQNQLDNLLEKNSEFNILEKEKPVYDNLNPIYYLPKMDFNNLNIPENNVISENIDEEGEEQKTYGITEMEEVIVYADQQMLRRLRNEYLHWSSNRDWFGMEPNTNRIRKEF